MHGSLIVVSAFSIQDATQATSQCFRRCDSRTVTLNAEPQIPGSIAASMLLDLVTVEQDQEQRGNIVSEETSKKETSSWL
jgi:hypothetical protein